MGRPRSAAGVLGPYREARRDIVRYRVVKVDQEGQRTAFYGSSSQEAEVIRQACAIALGMPQRTVPAVSKANDSFVTSKRTRDCWAPATFERTERDLRTFAAGAPDTPVDLVGRDWMMSWLERVSYMALASQRSRFLAIAEFLRWCVRQGWLPSSPCELLDEEDKPWLGKRARRKLGRGKPQLRNVGEARKYLAVSQQFDSAMERVAAALPLLTGLRSGELLHLRVADIDQWARRIWVRGDEQDDDEDDGAEESEAWDVKSLAGRRSVELPKLLEADLHRLCEGKPPEQLLFPSTCGPMQVRGRAWLLKLVNRTCTLAGTRMCSPHGLRDTVASLSRVLAGHNDARHRHRARSR
jgi:integrase